MRFRFLNLALLLLLLSTAGAQAPSPQQALGYTPGSRYTPHHLIVQYFQQVAATLPGRVRLENYGETNEGRPLMVAYISSAANLARLAEIRDNNHRLATGSGNTQGPVIVWLSYNVHGNEPSSSEAAMRTLWALVDPTNTATKAWLENTVVVIDPCLNPDGRDRYVNWFNGVRGNTANAQLSAREHNEPWPGGRVNHYYFDLNRDWAWQTQKESQERVKIYRSWMPQVHVDFHEQGINNPYYFAPAAEPYHEVITPWQRDFQKTIGANHARYFDERGWLYFTREVFDLFYPAYGDTYPLYNGAIGMTYEQGGGPAGGLAALTNTGDTLTLADRVEHHYTTGMSTIEAASKNAAALVQHFQDYFSNAGRGAFGEYKSFVIKYRQEDEDRINRLKELLTKNDIQFRQGSGGARGYNYFTRKEESMRVENKDIVISGSQPNGALVRVLFEPNPKLADSVTYDITAWSLPYVYGLQAYALRSLPATQTPTVDQPAVTPSAQAYAFVLRWDGVRAAAFASQAIQAGIRLRIAQKPFTAGGQNFDRGSLILLRNGQDEPAWNKAQAIAAKSGISLHALTSGLVESGADFGSSSVRPMIAPRVALLSGDGVSNNAMGEVWHFFEQQIGYPVTIVNSSDFSRTDWSAFNVLILPNGNYRFLNDKASAESLRGWVQKGGKLIALEGAMSQLSGLDWGLKARKDEDSASDARNPYASLRHYANRERDEIPNFTPGSIYKVELDNTHPLAFGYPSTYYTLRQDDRRYEFFNEGGWNVGVIKRGGPVAGFVGNRLQSRLQDALLFGVQDLGNGEVVYLADDVLFRSFWENGKLLFANAVFMVGQ